MIEGHIKVATLNGSFGVLFVPHGAVFGGPVKAQWIYGIQSLRRFMENLGCPLSEAQVLDAEQVKPIRGTAATRHAVISSGDYRRYFA